MKFTNKEMILFWLAILIGVWGGIAGNMLASSVLDIANNGYKTTNTTLFLASAIIVLIIIFYIRKKLNTPIKKAKK